MPPPPICLLRGTQVRTATGDRAIEDLAIGDAVATLSGVERPIRWIGRQRFRRSAGRAAWAESARPVRIRAFAFDAHTPSRDLLVSQAHAIYLDGALVAAGDLVNGRSIVLDPVAALPVLDYFNIELDHHDVIFAEGAAVETFVSRNGNREMFDNFVEYERLYGTEPAATGAPFAPKLSFNGGRNELRSRVRRALAPILDRRTELDRIRDRIDDRAVLLDIV